MYLKTQKSLNSVFSRVIGRTESHVRTTYRTLVANGLLTSSGPASASDSARMLLALMSCERPVDAPEALQKALGLVAIVDGVEQPLVALVELILDELMETGTLGGVSGLKLHVGHPWPMAGLQMLFSDGTERAVEFHHRDARGEDASTRQADLEQRWGYKSGTGGNRWAVIDSAGLDQLGDALAGRTRQQRPRLADLLRPVGKPS